MPVSRFLKLKGGHVHPNMLKLLCNVTAKLWMHISMTPFRKKRLLIGMIDLPLFLTVVSGTDIISDSAWANGAPIMDHSQPNERFISVSVPTILPTLKLQNLNLKLKTFSRATKS